MTHIDWQQIAAFGLVALAFGVIGRRLWSQVLAFRSRPVRRTPQKSAAQTPPAPLIQIQVKPPVHLKRPPPEGR